MELMKRVAARCLTEMGLFVLLTALLAMGFEALSRDGFSAWSQSSSLRSAEPATVQPVRMTLLQAD